MRWRWRNRRKSNSAPVSGRTVAPRYSAAFTALAYHRVPRPGYRIELVKMWRRDDDDSVVDQMGRVLYVSPERFERSICLGTSCFICGATRAQAKFNDEHVVPAWLLRRFELFDRSIQLPNGTEIRYDRYKISCCADCNSRMGRDIETPIRELLSAGYKAVSAHVAESGGLLLFTWLGLVFLKTHLRDRSLRMLRDRRRGSDPISSRYDWESLHHLHTVVRSLYSGAEVSAEVRGTLVVLPAKAEDDSDRFAYVDLYATQVALLRMDDFALLTVFNDGGACSKRLMRVLRGATGPFLPPQLREVLVEAAVCNWRLKSRPQFRSQLDVDRQINQVVAKLPNRWRFNRFDSAVRGRLMEYVFDDLIRGRNIRGSEDEDQLRQEIREGRTTFLFDKDGKFITKSLGLRD